MKKSLLFAGIFFAFTQILVAQGTGSVVKAAIVDENNVKWFGTDLGLLSFDGTDWTAYNVNVEAPGAVSSIAYDEVEGMLIGTNHGYLEADNSAGGIQTAYMFNTMTMEVHDQQRDAVISSEEQNISLNQVNDVMYDQDLTKYVVTDNGLLISEGERKVWLEKGYGLPESGLTLQPPAALGHEKDTVYIGTPSGVGRISPKTFKLGSFEDQSLVISEDEIDGYTGSSYYVQPYSGIAANDTRSVLTDTDGYQWFGTTGGVSLHRVQNGDEGWDLNLTTSDGLVNNVVNTIFQDSNGDLWFGTEGGVSKYVIQSGNFTNYTTTEGLSDNMVYDITEDQDNTLWFATGNGISSFNGSAFTTYNTADQATNFVTVIVNSVFSKNAASANIRVYPNPASGFVYLHYSKKADMYIEAHVTDVTGKRLATLFSGYAGGGDLKVRWDLQDADGQPVNPGVYFINVDDGNAVRSLKFIVL